ncbi:T9SS type A sorting domain-containing protein [Salibacteraceae bacterium]|nr:T9SS type A sorting domain-containing protein [Salibacteraceae bacterium]
MKAFITLIILIASYTSIAQFSQDWIPLPSESNITNGPTNGFWFTAESDFTIDALKVPDDAMSSSNAQSIAVLKFTGSGASTTPSTNYTVLFLVQDTITSDSIPCNIDIENGDHIGVIGSRFSTTSNAEQSSNTATSNYSTTIGGQSIPLYRLLANSPLGNQNPSVVWTASSATIVRIEMFLETCSAPEPSSITIDELACFGDTTASISATVSGSFGPFVMEWSNGDSAVNSISNLGAGEYTLSIANSYGCIGDSVITIEEPDSLYTDFIVVEPLCHDEATGTITSTPVGGIPPYSYNWVGGSTSNTLSNLTVGPYMLTVTDSNGCEFITPGVMTHPTELVLAIDTIMDVNCPADSNGEFWVATVGGTVPYTYLWNDPMAQTNPNATDLKEGYYSISATDLNGCVSVLSDSVGHIYDRPSVNLGADQALPNSGTLTLNGPGNMTSYLWSTQSTYPSIIVPFAGTYWIWVEDENGCTNSDTIVIFEPTPEGISEFETEGLSLSPNPASGSSTLTFDEPGIQYQVQIVNQHGQLVFLETASNKLQLNCVDLPSGNYFIIATSQKDNILAKLQVIH